MRRTLLLEKERYGLLTWKYQVYRSFGALENETKILTNGNTWQQSLKLLNPLKGLLMKNVLYLEGEQRLMSIMK